jgi:hypothetical protein
MYTRHCSRGLSARVVTDAVSRHPRNRGGARDAFGSARRWHRAMQGNGEGPDHQAAAPTRPARGACDSWPRASALKPRERSSEARALGAHRAAPLAGRTLPPCPSSAGRTRNACRCTRRRGPPKRRTGEAAAKAGRRARIAPTPARRRTPRHHRARMDSAPHPAPLQDASGSAPRGQDLALLA